MPVTGSHLTEQELLEDLRQNAFAPTDRPTRIGLEVEQLAFHGIQTAPLHSILEALQPLVTLGELRDITSTGKPPTFESGDSVLTFEPGGQLEIVSPPRESAVTALRDIAQLETLLDGALTWRGIRRANHGMTPWQGVDEISLQTPLPRYQAMQAYFSEIGPDGVRMMRLSCSLQINIGAGSSSQVEQRWRAANLMSPILMGMFANSPMAEGRVTGWKSTRAHVVAGMDPSRSGAILGPDGPSAYLEFALRAGVLLRRTAAGYVAGSPSLSFRDWLASGDMWGYPTLDDWHYHLTTLWPMVRPRGFLELRALDTTPVRWRSVPVAVVSALLLDDEARESALRSLDDVKGQLQDIAAVCAHDGLEHPAVQALAQQLMQLAREAFSRLPSDWLDDAIIDDVRAFDEQYTARGRCPADDLLDLHQPELRAARRPSDPAHFNTVPSSENN
ncbi:MAG: glutamate-cysteine ligase family protein [Chloroflexota bacterium]